MTHVECNYDGECRWNKEGECKSEWITVCDEICMTYEKEPPKC